MADQKLNSAFGSIKVRTEDDDPAKSYNMKMAQIAQNKMLRMLDN